jgi:hypothetical protein
MEAQRRRGGLEASQRHRICLTNIKIAIEKTRNKHFNLTTGSILHIDKSDATVAR